MYYFVVHSTPTQPGAKMDQQDYDVLDDAAKEAIRQALFEAINLFIATGGNASQARLVINHQPALAEIAAYIKVFERNYGEESEFSFNEGLRSYLTYQGEISRGQHPRHLYAALSGTDFRKSVPPRLRDE